MNKHKVRFEISLQVMSMCQGTSANVHTNVKGEQHLLFLSMILEILRIASDRGNETAEASSEWGKMSRVTKSLLPSHHRAAPPSLLLRAAPHLMYHQPN